MEYLVNAAQMKSCDNATIEHFKVPSLVLMERAALACADVLIQRERQKQVALSEKGILPLQKACVLSKVLIVGGCGNNGGDGFAIGRLLMQAGFPVDFVLIGKREKCSEQTERQLAILESYGCTIMSKFPEAEYDIIIDALFGIGLTRNLEGIYLETVKEINRRNSFVLSVDIPSGIHADTGAVMGDAVMADVTVTFAFKKLGSIFYPGRRYTGQYLLRQIGITQESFLDDRPEFFTYTGQAEEYLPVRDQNGNKGSFGKVMLLAGSKEIYGACALSAEAVLRTGAGMIKVVTEESNRDLLFGKLPEAMLSSYRDNDRPENLWQLIKEVVSWADIAAAGPGMGMSETAACLLDALIQQGRQPLILDADAINLLAAHGELAAELERLQKSEDTRRTLVFTPHPAELARLADCQVREVLDDPVSKIRQIAKRFQAWVICKGACTMAGGKTGMIYVNTSGDNGMATAGSGDVLTGIIAGLLAQGMEGFEAVCAGVYLHGLAGERTAHKKSSYSMTAGDLAGELAALMQSADRNRF